MNCTGWFFYGLPYYTQVPDYICTWEGEPPADPSSVCTKENIIAGDKGIATWEIDEDAELGSELMERVLCDDLSKKIEEYDNEILRTKEEMRNFVEIE